MNDDVQTNYAWGQTVGDGCRDTAVDKLLHQPATCGSLLTRKFSNPQPPLSGWLGGGRRKSSCRVRPRCRFEVRVVRSQQLPRIALRAFLGEDESLLEPILCGTDVGADRARGRQPRHGAARLMVMQLGACG